MIIKRALHVKECRVYAYAGKPLTCRWCGYKLKKPWWHSDYTVIGSKDVKMSNKPPEAEPELRPIWQLKPDAPDRGRGLVIDRQTVRTGLRHMNPHGNNHFCSFSCATLWGIATLDLGCIPEPIDPKAQAKLRRLFQDEYGCDQKRKNKRNRDKGA